MKKRPHSRSRSFWHRVSDEFSALPAHKKFLFCVEICVALAALLVTIVFSFVMFRVPSQVDSAIILSPCKPLLGTTTAVVYSGGVDKKGFPIPNNVNTGRIFFDPSGPAQDGSKPVYYAPPSMQACAQRVGNRAYLLGWAWNSNLGWTSLYCPGDGRTNMGIPCGLVNYGSYIDMTTGKFYGYAWSNAGWIRFNSAATPEFGDSAITTSSFAVQVNPASIVGDFVTVPAAKGHAWTDTLGWMNFGGMKIPWSTTILPDTKDVCPNSANDCLARDAIFADDGTGNGSGGGGGGDVGGSSPSAPDITQTPSVPDSIVPQALTLGLGSPFPVTFTAPYFAGGFKAGKSGGSSGGAGGAFVSAQKVRNAIYKNVFRWKQVASRNCGVAGSFLLKFDTKDSVFYCKGDVYLSGDFTGNKTIIVDGGNVFLQGNLFSDGGQLGIIALSKSLKSTYTGNVYIYPEVRDLRATIYADGGVYPFPDPCEVNLNIKPNALSGACDPMNASGDFLSKILASNGEPVFDMSQYYVQSPVTGSFHTLFGQLYLQGSVMSAQNVGPGSALGAGTWAKQMQDFSYLRSVPADPDQGNNPGVPYKGGWSAFVKEVQDKIDPSGELAVDGGDDDSSDGNAGGANNGKSGSGNDTSKKKLKLFSDKKGLDTKKQAKLLKVAQSSSKVSDKIAKNASTSGVVILFEPPSSDLAGFEGLSGGGYKQTGGF